MSPYARGLASADDFQVLNRGRGPILVPTVDRRNAGALSIAGEDLEIEVDALVVLGLHQLSGLLPARDRVATFRLRRIVGVVDEDDHAPARQVHGIRAV